MGGEEDGAAVVADLAHHALEQVGGLGVQAYEGLIHDDDLRVVEPRGNDGQLLLHAVGIGGNGLGQVARQLKGIRVGADTSLPGLGVHAEYVGDEVQIFDAGHVVVQIRIIGDVGHLPLAAQGIGLDGPAVDGDLALVKLQNAHHGFQRGGLAGAVMADEAVDLAGGDVQRQIVHGLLLAVGLGQMLNVQHGVSSSYFSPKLLLWGIISRGCG